MAVFFIQLLVQHFLHFIPNLFLCLCHSKKIGCQRLTGARSLSLLLLLLLLADSHVTCLVNLIGYFGYFFKAVENFSHLQTMQFSPPEKKYIKHNRKSALCHARQAQDQNPSANIGIFALHASVLKGTCGSFLTVCGRIEMAKFSPVFLDLSLPCLKGLILSPLLFTSLRIMTYTA